MRGTTTVAPVCNKNFAPHLTTTFNQIFIKYDHLTFLLQPGGAGLIRIDLFFDILISNSLDTSRVKPGFSRWR